MRAAKPNRWKSKPKESIKDIFLVKVFINPQHLDSEFKVEPFFPIVYYYSDISIDLHFKKLNKNFLSRVALFIKFYCKNVI